MFVDDDCRQPAFLTTKLMLCPGVILWLISRPHGKADKHVWPADRQAGSREVGGRRGSAGTLGTQRFDENVDVNNKNSSPVWKAPPSLFVERPPPSAPVRRD